MSNILAPPQPEWAPHEAVWIGFPSDPELWLCDLQAAEREGPGLGTTVPGALEGGAIDHDGSGTVITTEQCLLNPNRNTLTREETEQHLLDDLGFERVVWLGSGLLNDHTDGHVDNLARFVAPGRVAIPNLGYDDPNEAVFKDAARRLRSTRLDVVTLPSPGRI